MRFYRLRVFLILPPLKRHFGHLWVRKYCDYSVRGLFPHVEELSRHVLCPKWQWDGVLDGRGFFGNLLEQIEQKPLFRSFAFSGLQDGYFPLYAPQRIRIQILRKLFNLLSLYLILDRNLQTITLNPHHLIGVLFRHILQPSLRQEQQSQRKYQQRQQYEHLHIWVGF